MDALSAGNQNFGCRKENWKQVIQSLKSAPHFLPATAADDSVAFARNPTSSLVHAHARLWLLYFLGGAFMFPVLCLFARFRAQCFFCFVFFSLSFECIGGSVSVQVDALAFALLRFSTAYVWTKAILQMMPCLWLLKQTFSGMLSSPCGQGLSQRKRWTSGPNSRRFELQNDGTDRCHFLFLTVSLILQL